MAELVKRLNRIDPGDNVTLLLGPKPTLPTKVDVAARVLAQAGIPARVVQGIRLQEEEHNFSKKTNLLHWLEVYDKKHWLSFDPLRGKTPVPDDWLRWWSGPQNLVQLEGGTKLNVVVSLSPKVEEGISAAVLRGEISKPLLLKLSLFGLPVNTQAVYRVMLLVPIGAFVLVILRNIVGIKTFGTFMPVLIALSFRETGLLSGIVFFTLVVATGLAIRFYMERLKLLLVPKACRCAHYCGSSFAGCPEYCDAQSRHTSRAVSGPVSHGHTDHDHRKNVYFVGGARPRRGLRFRIWQSPGCGPGIYSYEREIFGASGVCIP